MLTAGYSSAGQGKAAAVAKQMSQPSGRNVPKKSSKYPNVLGWRAEGIWLD
jgi:hypothetical protein